MKYIKLTRNKKAIVDDEDFDLVSKYKWYCSSVGYVSRTEFVNKKRVEVLLHRFLLNAKKGQEIDHINRNPLDNTRKNIRFCTRSENNHNRGMYKNNSSGYKGVYWHKKAKKWASQIMLNKQRINVGLFPNPLLAYLAIQNYAKTF